MLAEMKNLKKRIERLEKKLKPIQPLEEPTKPNVDTLGLTFEQRRGVREALESIELRINGWVARMIEEGMLDPSLEKEAKRGFYRLFGDYLTKMKAEREADKITENLK